VIFVDTGAFLARYLARDQYHDAAQLKWKAIEQQDIKCFTSNFVIDETITLLGRWAGHDFAVERANNIYASREVLTILRPDHDVEIKALLLFRKYSDQKVSFTDCVSFALMRTHKIAQAFSFDSHFQLVGFSLF